MEGVPRSWNEDPVLHRFRECYQTEVLNEDASEGFADPRRVFLSPSVCLLPSAMGERSTQRHLTPEVYFANSLFTLLTLCLHRRPDKTRSLTVSRKSLRRTSRLDLTRRLFPLSPFRRSSNLRLDRTQGKLCGLARFWYLWVDSPLHSHLAPFETDPASLLSFSLADGVVKIIATSIFIFVGIEKIGRKKALGFGGCGMSLFLFVSLLRVFVESWTRACSDASSSPFDRSSVLSSSPTSPTQTLRLLPRLPWRW